MANYESTCRTNYFKVKDIQKFREWFNSLCGEGMELCDDHDGEFCILCDNGWPNFKGDDYDNDIDFVDELRKHLQKGQVAVLMEAGHEKHRYCTGRAIAITPGRKWIAVDINDIYQIAKKRFGIKDISDAEY